MDNLIKFKTDNIPLVTRKCMFPYDDVVGSLKALDKTKAIILNEKEMNPYHLTKLRKITEKMGIGYVKKAQKGDKIYLWLANRKED